MNKVIGIFTLMVFSQMVNAGIFKNKINEIQVYQDRVRVHTGGTYGTCGDSNGWFGWKTSSDRHQDWLSLVLAAKASGTLITMYEQHNSCSGLSDAVEIEGVFWPKSE